MTTTLNYKKFGNEGEVLIILHGLFGSLDNWQSIAQNLAKYFQVYIVDQRNHGKSPHFSEHNYTLMAADLKQFMEQLSIDSANLLGHSMGGKTVMQFAIENPQMVNKLIVADIAPKYYAPHHQSILKALNAVDFSKISNRKEAEDVLNSYISDAGTKQFLLKNLTWETQDKLTWKFNFKTLENEIENIGEELNGFAYFTNPTLFLKGEKSNYILESDLDKIEEIFPLSKVVEIKNSGHWLHAENPKDFINEVLNFIK